jgi:arylsulfatase A-like enzyme
MPERQEGTRPDILLVVADDLGWADAGFRGGPARTPTLDRLADGGIVLDRFYVSPICTPTRAELMTGRWAIRSGLTGNLVSEDLGGLPRDSPILPELLADSAGYRTALTGKWHLGERPGFRPEERGFELAYGNLGGWIDHYTHKRAGTLDWYRNGEPIREPGYTADLLADSAIEWLRGIGPSEPFFLYVPFTLPHTPLQAPGTPIASTDGAVSGERRSYLAMVSALDSALGRIVAELQRLERLENTLVVFLSDNGGAIHFGASNEPLRAGKRTAFEGGIRVPALISWPSALPSGRRSSAVLSSVDVMPTLLDAAGIESRGALDGESMLSTLRSGEGRSPRDLFFASESRTRIHLGLLRFPLKLVVVVDLESGSHQEMMFDVASDPVEHLDLARSAQEDASALRRRLAAWWDLHPDVPRWTFPAADAEGGPGGRSPER